MNGFITIKKAKLKGRRLTIDYFRQVENGSDTISVKCANEVHPDLLSAMKKLVPHLILMCELPESTGLSIDLMSNNIEDVDTSEYPKIEVTGYSIGGNDEEEGLTIIGSRLLEKGKVLNINSPFTKYDREEYEYADELNLAIQAVDDEIRQFVDGKIYCRQMDVFEDTEKEDNPFGSSDIQIAVNEIPVTGKKGRKKKEVEPESEEIPA